MIKMNCTKGLNVSESTGVRVLFVEDIEECKKCPAFNNDYCEHWYCVVYEW